MSDRLFFFMAVVILAVAVAVAVWQFRSLMWGEIIISSYVVGKSNQEEVGGQPILATLPR